MAFLLLAGQHIPAEIDLAAPIGHAWVLNASAQGEGAMVLTSGDSSCRIDIGNRDPIVANLSKS